MLLFSSWFQGIFSRLWILKSKLLQSHIFVVHLYQHRGLAYSVNTAFQKQLQSFILAGYACHTPILTF